MLLLRLEFVHGPALDGRFEVQPYNPLPEPESHQRRGSADFPSCHFDPAPPSWGRLAIGDRERSRSSSTIKSTKPIFTDVWLSLKRKFFQPRTVRDSRLVINLRTLSSLCDRRRGFPGASCSRVRRWVCQECWAGAIPPPERRPHGHFCAN